MLPDETSVPTVMTIVGTVAKGSIIDKQIQDFTTPNLIASCTQNNNPCAIQVNGSPASGSTHPTPNTQMQEQPQLNLNDGTPDPASLVQSESDVPDISDLQVSRHAQSTGEPHVQIISIPQDHI